MHYQNDNPEIIEFGHSPNVRARVNFYRSGVNLLRIVPDVVEGAVEATKQAQPSEPVPVAEVVNITDNRKAKEAKNANVAEDSARGAVEAALNTIKQEYPDVLKKAA